MYKISYLHHIQISTVNKLTWQISYKRKTEFIIHTVCFYFIVIFFKFNPYKNDLYLHRYLDK